MGAALTEPTAERVGEGTSPSLQLDGFSGSLDLLLSLARAQQIDLARVSVPDLIDQLAAALQQAGADITLGQKGAWVVMAAWLVWLRSRLLLPAGPVDDEADAEGDQLRERLLALQQSQALARWLERRPQLGRDVFAGGQPELPALRVDAGPTVASRYEVDVVEFLWAGLALFGDAPKAATTGSTYQPLRFDLCSVAEARERVLRGLAEVSDPASLERLVPQAPAEGEGAALSPLRRRSGWASTLIACLELAKQGEVATEQGEDFAPILVSRAQAAKPTGQGRGSLDV